MNCEVAYYVGNAEKFGKKLIKRLTFWDIAAIKLSCVTFGLFLASLFPRFTKKLRPVLAIGSLLLLIPLIIKMVRVFVDVFHIKTKLR